jgi:SAM-dependent methyltransferase
MHKSSYDYVEKFVNDFLEKEIQYPDDGLYHGSVSVLEVGSKNINGSLRGLFENKKTPYSYKGADLESGPNVDIILAHPYYWPEIQDESYDVIVSTSTLEHIEWPWLTMEQISKKLKVGGFFCITVPSRGPQHRFPVDCWRFYPDSMNALAKWALLEVVDLKWYDGFTRFDDNSDKWGDCCAIMKKVKKTP